MCKPTLSAYQKSKGVNTSSTTDGFLGLLWDFFHDELIPTLDVYLCGKCRGLNIKNCIITARTVLRITGYLYDQWEVHWFTYHEGQAHLLPCCEIEVGVGYKHLHHTYRDYKGCTSVTNADFGDHTDLEPLKISWVLEGHFLVDLLFPLVVPALDIPQCASKKPIIQESRFFPISWLRITS